MNNFTTNTYEMKREIVNFSKKIAEGVNKCTSKFVMDMQYGLSKGGSCLISNIARSLQEKIKLNYTIERLCDNLATLYDDEKNIIWNNYIEEVKNNIDCNNAVVLFDDSDINKEYSKKLEDLDRVIDASSKDKRISFNKGYTDNGFADKVYHIHLRYLGDNDELYFRDYMNEYPQIAKQYESLKLKLWKKYEYDRDAYTNAKTDFIIKWTTKAREIYGDRY